MGEDISVSTECMEYSEWEATKEIIEYIVYESDANAKLTEEDKEKIKAVRDCLISNVSKLNNVNN